MMLDTPPAVEAGVAPQPQHPLGDVCTHKVLGVVDVGSRPEAVPRAGVPAPPEVAVVRDYGARVPRQPPAELVPCAVRILRPPHVGGEGGTGARTRVKAPALADSDTMGIAEVCEGHRCLLEKACVFLATE